MSEELVTPEENSTPEETLASEEGQEPEAPVDTPEIREEVSTPEEKPVATPIPAPIPVSVPEKPKQEKKVAVPVAVSAEEIQKVVEKSTNSVVIGAGDKDEVRLSAIIYKNFNATRSVSVFHVQRRLYELGYQDATSDKRGFFGDNTKNALAYFQSANSLEASGLPNAETLTLLFTGDENVYLTLN